MELNLADIVLTIRCDSPASLRSWLYGQSVNFSAACRRTGCRCPGGECGDCAHRDDCPWLAVFGQGLAEDPEALRRHQKPPLPFAFSFAAPGGRPPAARSLECRLVLLGRAIGCLEMLLEGVAQLLQIPGVPARSELVRCSCRDYQGTQFPLWQGGVLAHPENLTVLSAAGLVESRPWHPSLLRVDLRSPLKLMADGRQVTRFNFALFGRSLLRRVSSLAYYYGEEEPRPDFRDLSRQAEAIVCTDATFRYQHGRGSLSSGIVGSGCFQGDFGGLLPFLVIGTYVHTGKSAAFGLGDYELVTG